MNDNPISRSPVRRSRDLVLVTNLEGIDHTKDLVELTTGRGGVGQGETDRLLGVDDVDGTDCEGDTGGRKGNEKNDA